jgi:hypothetical protein
MDMNIWVDVLFIVSFFWRKWAFSSGSILFFADDVSLFPERICSSNSVLVLCKHSPANSASVSRPTPQELDVFLIYGHLTSIDTHLNRERVRLPGHPL